jgi:hypothetical protein
MRAVSQPPLRVDRFTWLTLHLNDEILDRVTIHGMPDRDQIASLAREAADAVFGNMPYPTREGRFSAGPAGEFSLKMGERQEKTVQFEMRGPKLDADYEQKRVYATLGAAANQLRGSENPGLVIMDSDADLGLHLNHPATIYEMLRTEPWARPLAGVAIVSQMFTTDEVLREVRPNRIVTIIPGFNADALTTTLMPHLRPCERGHLHVDTLVEPPKRCEVPF